MECQKCNSTNGYTRLRTKEFVCRRCGEITKPLTAKSVIRGFMGEVK